MEHELEVQWDTTTMRLGMYAECGFQLSYEGDIVNDIFDDNSEVFLKFTASTGGKNNEHLVCIDYNTFLNGAQAKCLRLF